MREVTKHGRRSGRAVLRIVKEPAAVPVLRAVCMRSIDARNGQRAGYKEGTCGCRRARSTFYDLYNHSALRTGSELSHNLNSGEPMTDINDDEGGTPTPYNGFRELWAEVATRLRSPVRHLNFWIVLVGGVLIFGGHPIWIEVVKFLTSGGSGKEPYKIENMALAIATVFPAIMGGSAFELFVNNKSMPRNIGIIALIFCVVGTWALLWFEQTTQTALIGGSFCCLVAVFVWWLARGLDDLLRDQASIDPYNPVGGPDPQSELSSKHTTIRT